MEKLKLLILKIQLEIQILQIQLRIVLLREKLTVPNLPGPKYIVIHHSAGRQGFYEINEYHKQKWGFKSSLGFYLGYHKWIAYDGKLYIARQNNEEGAHCVEPGRPGFWNKNSVGICCQGDFTKEQPTEAQLLTLTKELHKYDIPIKMHYEIVSTLCPGENLIKWVKEYR